jgi:hypothetical protein
MTFLPTALIPTDGPAPLVGTSPLHAGLVALGLLAVSWPLAVREGRRHGQSWLAPLLLLSLVLHLLGSVAQAEVVRHLYDNAADFQKYDGQGAALADGLRHLQLDTTGLGKIPGTGAVSVATGAVYAVVGVDQLGGFFVFTWLGLIGLVGFHRAALLAVPDLVSRRYATILFLLPSLLYWPSAVGKEALMLGSLGVAAYGCALLLVGRVRGLLPLAAGLTGASYVRPHTAALLAVSLVVAAAFGSQARRAGRVLALGVGVVVLAVVGVVAVRFLDITHLSHSTLTAAVEDAHDGTQGSGGGFGSSYSGWSSSPLAFPRDVVIVLLEPLPWRVTSVTQAIALTENLVFVGLAVRYRASLRSVPGAARRNAMVRMAAVYSVLFVYVFSALGNIGLLVRERTLLLPLLLLLVCLGTRTERRGERRARGPQRADWDVPGVLLRR